MRKVTTAGAIVGLALFGLAAQAPAHAAPPTSAAKNHTSYWESQGAGSCTKVEFGNGVESFTLPPLADGTDYSLLVLKAGTVHEELRYVFENESYASTNGKDLSNAIYCTVRAYS